MFLQKGDFTFRGHSVELIELSALLRIDFVKYTIPFYPDIAADELNKISDVDMGMTIADRTLNVDSRIVAMSLWQKDPENLSIDKLQQEVKTTWPQAMISGGAVFIKELSDMMPPPPAAETDSEEVDKVVITAEKPTPAS